MITAALAAAAIRRPDEGEPIEARVLREACARAWKLLEVALCGRVLGRRLARTTDHALRGRVSGFLDVFGRDDAAAVTALREAPLDAEDLDPRRTDGDLEAALADYPALRAHAELVVTLARALVRLAAPGSAWLWPAAPALEAMAIAGIAPVLDSAELERLLTLPPYVDENVQFTVYRPRALAPGTWHPLLAFAHLAERRVGDDGADPIEEVQRQAAHALGGAAKDYQDVTQDSRLPVPIEGELTFVPEVPGIEFNPPRRTFVWLEPVHREEFRMRADAMLDGKTARGRLSVFLGHILIAEVSLGIRVDRGHVPTEERAPAEHARPYRKIFASYSHQDLAIVAELERYGRAIGDEYLRDWMHLRTGEVWAPRLEQLIEEADVFQLFWSSRSMQSKFVQQEWEHALKLARPSFVRPLYWEDPMPKPPAALAQIHFQKLGGAAAAVAMAPEPPAPAPVRPSAQKREEGVLFSLRELRSIEEDRVREEDDERRAAEEAGIRARMEADQRRQGDGLIDIRSMAQAYVGSKEAPDIGAGVGGIDDLPVFSAASFADPSVVLPPAGGRQSSKRMMILIAVAVALAVLAVLAVIVFAVLLG